MCTVDGVELSRGLERIVADRAGRRLVIGVMLVGFCGFLDLYSTQALLPYLRGVFAASALQVSKTVGATTLAVAISAPFIGLMADAVGRKRVVVGAILALAAPTLLAAGSSRLHQLIFWRFLQGLCLPGIIATTMAYISEEAAPGTVGSTMAAYVTGTVVGGFVGRFMAGVVAAQAGWRWSFLALGMMTLVGGIIAWVCLPPSRRFVRQTNFGASLRAFAGHLGNPQLLATYAVGFNVLFSLVGTFTYVNFYLSEPPYRLGTVALSSIFFVYLLGMVITPLAGRWIDRIGYRKVLAMAVCLSASGALLTLAPKLPMIIAGLAVAACGVFICQSAASSHVGVAARGAKSSAAGLYVALYYAGGSAGSYLPGLLWERGGWPACVALTVAVQLATAVLALATWTEKPHQGAQPPRRKGEDEAFEAGVGG